MNTQQWDLNLATIPNQFREKRRARSRRCYAKHREERCEYQRRIRAENPEKVKEKVKRSYRKHIVARRIYAVDYSLKKKYGITRIQKQELLVRQKFLCAICKTPESGVRGWQVDHDHKTGKIRGLLCNACNIGLGMFHDNPESLANAIEYLRCQN